MSFTHLEPESSKPSRVVILGAAGFVAAASRRRLEKAGIDVLALPRTELDLTDRDAGENLAAMLRPDDSLLFVSAKAPVKNEAMLLENLRMGAAVCDALRVSPVAHLVYVSSDAVYADSAAPLSEASCAQPGSLHGVMHLAREVILANAYGGPLCLLRPTLIYGEGDPHNGYGPNRFARLAAAGRDIELFGEGEERRDHVWVEDVAEVIMRTLQRRTRGILNIASGEVMAFGEIASRAASLAGGKSRIVNRPRVGPMPHNGLRPFDVSALRAAFPDHRCLSIHRGLEKLASSRGPGLSS